MREASFYTKEEGGKVRCVLCAHRCLIENGKIGLCGVRANRDGILYTLNYDRLVSHRVDPIEKKPLFHFKPGSKSLSIATVGCNMRCTFCQNYEMSQFPRNNPSLEIPGKPIAPADIVAAAKKQGCETISFTYTEPTIFAELAYDTAVLAAKESIDAVFVTNGYMTQEMLQGFGKRLRAANVDLKTFNDESYRRTCGAKLEPVMESILRLHRMGCWVEVTTLVIPQFNDSDEELMQIASFLVQVNPNIPWHLSAFHPDYRMKDRPRTSPELLFRAHAIGKRAGLRYVYVGNLPGDPRESTMCPNCGSRVIERSGYEIVSKAISKGCCARCGETIDGVF